MITFAPTYLSPDLPQLAAWLVTEALAWFQSASPAQLVAGVWGVSALMAVGGVAWGRWGLR